MQRTVGKRKKVPPSWRVAAVQMTFAGTIDGNLEKIQRAVTEAARRRADAVLFPECAVTGYRYNFTSLNAGRIREALKFISDLAAHHRLNLLVGSPVYRGTRWQNCLVAFDRTGRVAYCYAKCQLTEMDRRFFSPGNRVALIELDGVVATAIICHERRYPELVRLAVMAGAQVLFHPNAGMDSLSVSKRKRGGRDGIAVRAFENAIYYVFANSVGPQGNGKWSAGDSKIVAPDGRILRLAGNRDEAVIVADLDLKQATRKYALESLRHPRFLSGYWRKMIQLLGRQGQ
ncbi:MAG: carbon-nitrogen hydrolase family protein [Verrucomicrobia subdivision 3 bacterium]|nr:carbon-nitrogen hydrolase family protein [Limisphaerales bacterium]